MTNKSQNMIQKTQNYYGTAYSLVKNKPKKNVNPYYHPLDEDEEVVMPTYSELLIQMLEDYHPRNTWSNSKIKNTSKISFSTPNNSTMNQFNCSRTITFSNVNKIPNFQLSKKNSIENYKNSDCSKRLKNAKSVEIKKLNMNKRSRGKLKKVYRYESNFMKNKDKIINSKDVDLEQYQENLLKLSGNTFCKDNMIKLYTEFKNLRNSTETIKPLPPINFPALIRYTVEKNKNNQIRKVFKKDEKGKVNEKEKEKGKEKVKPKYKRWGPDNDVEEYEKELLLIKKSCKSSKCYKFLNPNYQKYEMQKYSLLPEYLVESIRKRKKEI